MFKKSVIAMLIAFLGLFVFTNTAFADAAKGQKIIIKKLKKDCGFNGAVLAHKHTQDEWKALNEKGEINDEIMKICPNAKPLKEKYIPHVYDFLFDYALDSGNVPSC